MVGAFFACGGKVVVDEPPEAPEAGAACAADTGACQLPGVAPATDACGTCVSASICTCHDLNSQHWSVPTSCDGGTAVCLGSAGMTSDAACQVAAVAMTWCLVERTHDDCSSLYVAAHPTAAIEPLGMELGLFDCAVCAACAGPCAGTPNVAGFCDDR
jgi:hypothetical protein